MTVNVVSEEVQVRNTKDALVGVDNDAMRGETFEDSSHFLMCCSGMELAMRTSSMYAYLVHEPPECLSCVSASKRHPDELKQSKWRNGL